MNRSEAEKIGNEIVDGFRRDFTDRRGLRHQWDEIDEDIQAEIIAAWQKIAADAIIKSDTSTDIRAVFAINYLKDIAPQIATFVEMTARNACAYAFKAAMESSIQEVTNSMVSAMKSTVWEALHGHIEALEERSGILLTDDELNHISEQFGVCVMQFSDNEE